MSAWPSVPANWRRPSIPVPHRSCRRPNWPPERLAKAERNYAMEYIRSGLPRLAEIFGPAEAAHLGRVTGRLIGAQQYCETAALLGIEAGGADAFGRYMLRLAAGEGDAAALATQQDGATLVRRAGWRLMRGLEPLSPAIFEGLEWPLGGCARGT